MDIIIIIEQVAQGFTCAYLLMLGIYLLLSRYSVFSSDIRTNKALRKTTGYSLLLWSSTYIPSIFITALPDNDDSRYLQMLSDTYDLLVIPATVFMVLSLLQLRPKYYKLLFGAAIPPVLAFFVAIVNHSDIILLISRIYWIVYVFVALVIFIIKGRQYHIILRSQFSDLGHRDLTWIIQVAALLIIYYFVYTLGTWQANSVLMLVSYVLSSSVWSLMVWHTEHQEEISNMWAREEDNDDENTSATRYSMLGTAQKTDEYNSTYIKKVLREQCVQPQAYLTSDLTIDALSRMTGVKNGILNRYFEANDTSFYEYINRYRIDYAAKIIDESNEQLTVKDVMMECGCRTENEFRSMFKKFKGISVTKYLKRRNLTAKEIND